MTWSLQKLLASLHDDIERRLGIVRDSFGHPGTKGDASEQVWLELLQTYLPVRYRAAKAHVVDSNGDFSQQIDVLVFDRQYSPLIFEYEGQPVIPAESVYAAFETKQSIDAGVVAYAAEKVNSVRKLYRTSLPIPHAGGTHPPKPPAPILGGLLAFDSDWKPALGAPLKDALAATGADGQLDLGCIAAHGLFVREHSNYRFIEKGKPATAFLLELIAQLQNIATVPMIDVRAYARWLT